METQKITDAIDKLKVAQRRLTGLLQAKEKPADHYTKITFGAEALNGLTRIEFPKSECPDHLWALALLILETYFREQVAAAESELQEAMKAVLQTEKA